MIAIFNSREELYEVPQLPSGVAIGEPLIGLDGRVAISFAFSIEDLEVLEENGAILTETLPSDWQWPVVD
jgi:hypothetical protein